MDDRSGFPWLSASRLTELVLFAPHRREEDASGAPEVMKAIVRATRNYAGIYGTVTRIGRLAVGQTVRVGATGKRASG